jgi:hypothetical protein
VDQELRDWLRRLAVPPPGARSLEPLSDEGARYLKRIAADGTLKAVLDEMGSTEPELSG